MDIGNLNRLLFKSGNEGKINLFYLFGSASYSRPLENPSLIGLSAFTIKRSFG